MGRSFYAVILLLLRSQVLQILVFHLAKFCRFRGHFIPPSGYLNQRFLHFGKFVLDPVREQLPAVDWRSNISAMNQAPCNCASATSELPARASADVRNFHLAANGNGTVQIRVRPSFVSAHIDQIFILLIQRPQPTQIVRQILMILISNGGINREIEPIKSIAG